MGQNLKISFYIFDLECTKHNKMFYYSCDDIDYVKKIHLKLDNFTVSDYNELFGNIIEYEYTNRFPDDHCLLIDNLNRIYYLQYLFEYKIRK